MRVSINTLGHRMALISTGAFGVIFILLGDIFVNYKQNIIAVILPILLLVLLGLVLVTLIEFLQELTK